MTLRLIPALTALAACLCYGTAMHAQEPPCGVHSIETSTPLLYPPIARAAHVSGVVIVRAGVSLTGSIETAEVWQGPLMLRKAALDFVQGFHANPYGGSRTCLIGITFLLDENLPANARGEQSAPLPGQTGTRPLQYTIIAAAPLIQSNSDPIGKVIRRRLLSIF